MTEPLNIAGICGSLRRGSYNRATLAAAQELAPGGVTIDIIDLHDTPLFNQDVEAEGWPAPVQALRDRVAAADAVIFAVPEYNYSVPGVLKNAIDWLSRPEGKAPLNGKPCTIIGATPSMIGTARAQMHLRQIVFYNAMPLLPTGEILIGRAMDKFDEAGRLTDEDTRKRLGDLMAKFTDWARLTGRR